MNLLEMMKQEVSALKLEDKFDIAYHIYKRTGQMFEYDHMYFVADQQRKKRMSKKRIDPENVEEWYYTCFSWARLYETLLLSFGIIAKVKGDGSHDWVIANINDQVYRFDITKDYEDIMRMKFGLMPKHICKGVTDKIECRVKINNEQITEKEKFLEKVKRSFAIKKRELHLSQEEYNYVIYKWIERLMSTSTINYGYVSGTSYIKFLLKYLIGENYRPDYIKFFDKSLQCFIRVYYVKRQDGLHYFSYQMQENGTFQFKEIANLYELKEHMNTQKDNPCVRNLQIQVKQKQGMTR